MWINSVIFNYTYGPLITFTLYEHFEFIKEVENNFILIFRLHLGKISDTIRQELNWLWTEEW